MKYLYPFECETLGLSIPAELQAAIDGNRREGHRTNGPTCGPSSSTGAAGIMKHERESDGDAGEGAAVGEECAAGEDEDREPESDELLDGERDDSRSPVSPDEHRPELSLSAVAPLERDGARMALPALPPLPSLSSALTNLPLLALEKLLPALAQQMPLGNLGLAAAAAAAFSAQQQQKQQQQQQQHQQQQQQTLPQHSTSSQRLSLANSQSLLQPASLQLSNARSQLTLFGDGLHSRAERNGIHSETTSSCCPKRPFSATDDSSVVPVKRERRLHSSASSFLSPHFLFKSRVMRWIIPRTIHNALSIRE